MAVETPVQNFEASESKSVTSSLDSKPLVDLSDANLTRATFAATSESVATGAAAEILNDFTLVDENAELAQAHNEDPSTRYEREKREAQEMQSFLRNNMGEIDTDKNKGFVSRAELEEYRKAHPEHAQVIDRLLERYDEIQDAHDDEYFGENDGITLDDIDAYEKGKREAWNKR